MRVAFLMLGGLALSACASTRLAPPPPFQGMAYAEFSGALPAGAGCAFESPKDNLLVVATAGAEPNAVPQAAYKLDNAVTVVQSTRLGGFTALRQGASFVGRDLSFTIRPVGTRGTRAESGIETRAAELLVPGSKPLFGIWRCGT